MSDYGAFRAKLLNRIMEAKATPIQVADALERNRAKYPQITQAEIDGLKSAEDWKAVKAPLMPPASLHQRWDLVHE